jgi:hypothetical protein
VPSFASVQFMGTLPPDEELVTAVLLVDVSAELEVVEEALPPAPEVDPLDDFVSVSTVDAEQATSPITAVPFSARAPNRSRTVVIELRAMGIPPRVNADPQADGGKTSPRKRANPTRFSGEPDHHPGTTRARGPRDFYSREQLPRFGHPIAGWGRSTQNGYCLPLPPL